MDADLGGACSSNEYWEAHVSLSYMSKRGLLVDPWFDGRSHRPRLANGGTPTAIASSSLSVTFVDRRELLPLPPLLALLSQVEGPT